MTTKSKCYLPCYVVIPLTMTQILLHQYAANKKENTLISIKSIRGRTNLFQNSKSKRITSTKRIVKAIFKYLIWNR
jgi:hypothetical protein